jgi:2-polyprenyl-6-methoxyphenol hydroxylase-like FAD-dependent oxidoreductase
MTSAIDTDVLIVGAGPTGLMLANQLVRRGIRTMIIDRHAGPARETRALGVQARTMEIYAHLGIIDSALTLGRKALAANFWAQGKHAARIPLGDIGQDESPYPFLLILGQDDNERLLGENLRKLGGDVQWNNELVVLAQDADGVTTTLKQPDGSLRNLRAAWVGGCDGSRSAVRELSGIAFDGAPYEHVFFVADVEMTGPMTPGELAVYMWKEGFHLLFPMRGTDHWRIVGILPAALRGRDDVTFDEVLPAVRAELGADLVLGNCSWFSTYRIHHRRAERFRDRRCFLMGDAAHVHSPVGAQGMNTGLQDAYNLAWKLALVIQGRAAPTLLDSYEAERIPVAERLLSTTDRAFSLIVSDTAFAGLLRTQVIPKLAAFAMHFEAVRKFAFMTISQTGIEYRHSPLSKTLDGVPEEAPRAGDRFPWMRVRLDGTASTGDFFNAIDDTRFTLLLFGQDAPADASLHFEGRLRIIRVPADPDNDHEAARLHIPLPSFYLLRPDGHVLLAGVNPGALSVILSEAKDLLTLT